MKTDPIQRFWNSVLIASEDDCWLWQRAIGPKGYGVFKEKSYVQVYAHRFAYEIEKGPIPEGLTVDHLCNVRHCVNPRHLDICTAVENTHRGKQRRKLCKNGLHDMTKPDAWGEVKSNGTRYCRLCRQAAWRRSGKAKIQRRDLLPAPTE